MTTMVHDGLAERVQAAVLGAPGVRNVYRAGSLVSNLVGTGAAALGVTAANEPLVAVIAGEGGVRVESSLGIEYTANAIETLRAVRAAVDDLLAADGLAVTAIVLTVAYVHPRESSRLPETVALV